MRIIIYGGLVNNFPEVLKMDFSFNLYNAMASGGVCLSLQKILPPESAVPVILCIGSDLAVGDSLGPITGTLVRKKISGFEAYVYGTLSNPVTAKEVKYLNDFLSKTHPKSKIIAIDAAVGEDGDVGIIKITDGSLRPGSGANKRLGKVGDVSVLGIVAKKSAFSYSLLNLTRLNMVYAMSEIISGAISMLVSQKMCC